MGGTSPEQGSCPCQAGEGGCPPKAACLPRHVFPIALSSGPRTGPAFCPGAGEVVPAAGRKDSVPANSLIESSFEGKLVQPQIKRIPKCVEHDAGRVCRTLKNVFLQSCGFVHKVFLLSSSGKERERKKYIWFLLGQSEGQNKYWGYTEEGKKVTFVAAVFLQLCC